MKVKRSKYLTIFLLMYIPVYFLDHLVSKEGAHFSFENYPGFYAIFGFFAFILIVLVAGWLLRPIVMRKEDYYE